MSTVLSRRAIRAQSCDSLAVSPPIPAFYTFGVVKSHRQFRSARYVFISPPFIYVRDPVFTSNGTVVGKRESRSAGSTLVVIQPPPVPAVNSVGYLSSRLLLQKFQPADTARVLVRSSFQSVDWYATPLSSAVNELVNFIPVVGSTVLYYIWNFGDGETSTDRSPYHRFKSRGIYQVRLTVITLYGTFSTTKDYYTERLIMFDINDIKSLLIKLFPPGRAWSFYPGSVLSYLVAGIATVFYRIHCQIDLLIKNSLPSQAQEILSEWESEYGIPNDVYTRDVSDSIRRSQVVSMFTYNGNKIIPSKSFYINLARQLQYTVTDIDDSSISGYFECGISCCGDYLGEGLDDDICIVYVNGREADGERLERAFNYLKHADVIFQYIYTE